MTEEHIEVLCELACVAVVTVITTTWLIFAVAHHHAPYDAAEVWRWVWAVA